MLIRQADGSQLSGSRGGTTYSRNRYGAYARARSIPVNPRTDRQNAVRAFLRTVATGWASLSDVNKQTWKNYADAIPWKNKVGDTVHLTANAMYIRSNTSRLNAGLTLLDVAPSDLTLPDNALGVVASIDASAHTLSIAFDDGADWANETGARLVIQIGRPKSAGVVFYNGPWSFQGSISGNTTTPPTSPQTFDVAALGFAAGQTCSVRFRVLRADGRVSAPSIQRFQVVP